MLVALFMLFTDPRVMYSIKNLDLGEFAVLGGYFGLGVSLGAGASHYMSTQ